MHSLTERARIMRLPFFMYFLRLLMICRITGGSAVGGMFIHSYTQHTATATNIISEISGTSSMPPLKLHDGEGGIHQRAILNDLCGCRRLS